MIGSQDDRLNSDWGGIGKVTTTRDRHPKLHPAYNGNRMLSAILVLASAMVQTPPKTVWIIAKPDEGIASAEGVVMPGRTVVKKGQSIILRGNTGATETMVYVRSGVDTRASGKFTGSWELVWDTSAETKPRTKISIRYVQAGVDGEQVIRNCEVALVATDPITLTGTDDANGIKLVLSTAPTYKLTDPTILVDGNPVKFKLEADGSYRLGPDALASPNEKASVQVVGVLEQDGVNMGRCSTPAYMAKGFQSIKLQPAAKMSDAANPFESVIQVPVTGDGTDMVAYVDGRPIACERNGDVVSIDPRSVDPTRDVSLWVKGKTSSGFPAFSNKISIAESGIASSWKTAVAKIEEERTRLANVFGFSWFQDKVQGGKQPINTLRSYLIGNTQKIGPKSPTSRGPVVSLTTQKVIPVFADSSEQGRQAFASEFQIYWDNTGKNEKRKPEPYEFDLRKGLDEILVSDELRRERSFLGKYHQKLLDQTLEAIGEYVSMYEKRGVLRYQILDMPTFSGVAAFTDALNRVEVYRLKADQLLATLCEEMGKERPSISLTRYIVGPRDQNDTEKQATKKLENFDYIRNPVTANLFP